MLYKLYVLSISFFFLIQCVKPYSQDTLIGSWQGDYFGEHITISFDKQIFEMTIGNINLDNYKILRGSYSVNWSKKPIPISFNEISDLNHPLYSIIFFENKNTLIMTQFSHRWRLRSISFDDSEKNFTLQRI